MCPATKTQTPRKWRKKRNKKIDTQKRINNYTHTHTHIQICACMCWLPHGKHFPQPYTTGNWINTTFGQVISMSCNAYGIANETIPNPYNGSNGWVLNEMWEIVTNIVRIHRSPYKCRYLPRWFQPAAARFYAPCGFCAAACPARPFIIIFPWFLLTGLLEHLNPSDLWCVAVAADAVVAAHVRGPSFFI